MLQRIHEQVDSARRSKPNHTTRVFGFSAVCVNTSVGDFVKMVDLDHLPTYSVLTSYLTPHTLKETGGSCISGSKERAQRIADDIVRSDLWTKISYTSLKLETTYRSQHRVLAEARARLIKEKLPFLVIEVTQCGKNSWLSQWLSRLHKYHMGLRTAQ